MGNTAYATSMIRIIAVVDVYSLFRDALARITMFHIESDVRLAAVYCSHGSPSASAADSDFAFSLSTNCCA
jgi:hypothetical protein